jgi:hypothetical protein
MSFYRNGALVVSIVAFEKITGRYFTTGSSSLDWAVVFVMENTDKICQSVYVTDVLTIKKGYSLGFLPQKVD